MRHVVGIDHRWVRLLKQANAFGQVRAAIADDLLRHADPPGQGGQLPLDHVPCGMLDHLQGQHTDIGMAQAKTVGAQVGLGNSQDDQAARGAPLQGMVDNPDPIGTPLRHLPQQVQAQPRTVSTQGVATPYCAWSSNRALA